MVMVRIGAETNDEQTNGIKFPDDEYLENLFTVALRRLHEVALSKIPTR